jgi:hypothetical protein
LVYSTANSDVLYKLVGDNRLGDLQQQRMFTLRTISAIGGALR